MAVIFVLFQIHGISPYFHDPSKMLRSSFMIVSANPLGCILSGHTGVVPVQFVQMVPHLTLFYYQWFAVCFIVASWQSFGAWHYLWRQAECLSLSYAIFDELASPIQLQAYIFLVLLVPTNTSPETFMSLLLSLTSLSSSWAFAFLIAPLHTEAVFLYSSLGVCPLLHCSSAHFFIWALLVAWCFFQLISFYVCSFSCLGG